MRPPPLRSIGAEHNATYFHPTSWERIWFTHHRYPNIFNNFSIFFNVCFLRSMMQWISFYYRLCLRESLIGSKWTSSKLPILINCCNISSPKVPSEIISIFNFDFYSLPCACSAAQPPSLPKHGDSAANVISGFYFGFDF